ncbi:MAG: ABC transporter substrate-binding protein [Anaerolineae bacterium]
MHNRKLMLLALALVVVALVAVACGGSSTAPAAQQPAAPTTVAPAAQQPAPPPAAQATQAPAAQAQPKAQPAAPTTAAPAALPTGVTKKVEVKPGQTKISFWHAMGGTNGEAVQKMVDDFNASQDKYVVEATFQGNYDNSLAKLRAGLPTGDVPTLMQVYDIGTRLMTDLGVTTPIQKFIDAEKYDTSDLEPALLNYYRLNGSLNSMPFNASSPILYYNKDAFKKVGLDPEKPPRTWAEVADAAKKFKGVDNFQCGLALVIYGWFFEQWQATGGNLYADNENGRAQPATKVVYNTPYSEALLKWAKDNVDNSAFCNAGRNAAGGSDNGQALFEQGKAAMYIESTARLRGVVNNTEGKNAFKVGTAYLPRQSQDDFAKAGIIPGGASLWILKDRPTEEQQGAWEFIKYVAAPERQAFWHTATGYFPIRKSAYDQALDKEWRAKYPQFETAIQQLQKTPQSNVTSGALLGVFPTARQTIETGWEDVILGKKQAKDMLDAAAASVTKEIETYNKTVKTR